MKKTNNPLCPCAFGEKSIYKLNTEYNSHTKINKKLKLT